MLTLSSLLSVSSLCCLCLSVAQLLCRPLLCSSLAMSRSFVLIVVSLLCLLGVVLGSVSDASWPSDSHLDAPPVSSGSPLFPHVLSADDMVIGDSDWDEPDAVKHVMQATGGSSGGASAGGLGVGGLEITVVNFTINQCQPTGTSLSGIQVLDPSNSSTGGFSAAVGLVGLSSPVLNGGVLGTLTLQYLDPSTITLEQGSTGINQASAISFDATTLTALNLALDSIVYTPAPGLQDSVNEVALDVSVQSLLDSAISTANFARISFSDSSFTPIAIYPLEGTSFDNLTTAVNQNFSIPPILVSNLANPDDELAVHIEATNGLLTFTSNLSGIYVEPSINPLIFNLVGHLNDINRVLADLSFTAICPSGPSCDQISDAGFTITVRDFVNDTQCPVVAATDCILNLNSNNNSIIEAVVFPPTYTVITLPDGSTGYNISWYPLSATGWTPNQQQGEVTAYSVAISTDPSHIDYQQMSKALEYWHVLTNLTANTDYWVEVQIWSAAGLSTCPDYIIGGRSVCEPYPIEIHTGVNSPAITAVALNSVTSTTITFTTTPPKSDEVNSIVATVRLSNGTIVGSSPYIIIPVTVAGGAVVDVVTGLSPYTPYIITVASSNQGGMGPSTSITAWTKLAGPAIIGFVASDPSNANTVQSVGDIVTVTFNMDTNQPAVATMSDLLALFSFEPVALAPQFNGAWKSASELVLTINTVSASAVPAVGVERITVIGALKSADGVSDNSTATATLTGNWGMHGLGSYFVLPSQPIQLQENAETYLGVNTSFTAAMLGDGTRTYTLSIQLLEPILAGASLNGSSVWSTGGIFISTSGTASALQSVIASVVLTSPRSYFGDISLQYQLLSGTTVIGEAVQVLNVVHVNHVPIITAPNTVIVPLETVTAVSSIVITDVDVAVGSLTDSMTVTLSASAGGLLSFSGSANTGVVYAPSFTGPSPVYQLTGPLLAVNLALQSLQLTFEYTTVSYGEPADYFVLVSANDHGNGGQPNLVNTQRVYVDIVCPTAVSKLNPATITAATLTASANELTVTLSPPLSDAVLASPFFACSSIFDASSVSSFGSSARCHFTSTASIVVELDTDATVTYNSKVGVIRNAFIRCGTAPTPTAAASVSVQFDFTEPLGAVAISGPSMGSLCEDLTLTAVAFPSSAHALSYSWQLPAYIASSPLVSAVSLTGPSLTVPVAAFLELTTLPPSFTFSLTVTDFLGRVQTDSLSVSFDNAAKPLLLPLTSTTVRQHAEDALDISTLATMPSCPHSVFNAPPTFQVVYQWSVTPALPEVSLGTASSIHLPAHTLSYSANSQHVYTFTVEASLSTNPQLISKQEFSVVVLPSLLEPRIAGGVTRSVSSGEAVILDASSSFDPIATASSAGSEYMYVWSCQAAAPLGACYGADGSVLVLAANSVLSFTAELLTANTYTFTLQYSHPATGRSSTVRQTVVVLDPFSTAVDLSLNTASLVINTGDKLAVSASSSASPLYFNWTMVGSGAAHLPIDLSNAVVSSGSLSSLVLNGPQSASFFEAGSTYQITATATTAASESSYASTAVYVNIPPTCHGDLTLTVVESSTAKITALSTAFVMSINSSACVDADAEQTDVILFQFFRLDSSTGLYHWLTAASPVAATSDFVLPSGSSVVVGVRVLDRLGGHTEYTTTVTVAVPTGMLTVASFTSANISDAQLASEYGNAVTVAAAISAVLSTAVQSSLPASELQILKDSLLLDILLWSASLPDDYVTTVLADLVADPTSTSVWAANHTLAFVAAISGGDAMSASVNELRSVVAILDGITALIVNGQGSSSGGSRRRLLGSSIDAATLNTLNSELFAALNSLSIDLSTHMLTVEGDSLPITASHLSGELRRGVVGNDSLSVSLAGSTLTVPSVSVAPAQLSGSMYDLALFVTPSAAFEYVAQIGQVSEVFFAGAYSVASYSSPLAPHTVSSQLVPSLPSSVNYSATLDLLFSASLAGSCLNTVDSVTGLICSLECRQWNGTAFDKSGVSTDFLALSNTTHTARCVVTQPGVYALFKSDEVGLVIPSSSTGVSSTGNGLPVDQSNAVRASVSFPAPFTVTNMRDFKLGLVQDLAAVTGEPASRFNIEQVTTNTLTGATSVILDIWVPVADGEATSQAVYLQLAGLATLDVLSTSYLRYADLSSWLEQCSDLVFRAVCTTSSSSSDSSWMLPLIISASAAGFLLLCALTVLAARRYWSTPSSKDDKTLEDFTLPSATATGAAKQYIYSPPTAGKELDAEISRADEEVADVVLVAGNAGIDPHTAKGVAAGMAEEEISEPVIVESEAEAAELAKQGDLHASTQRSADSLYDDEEKELSVNSASASGQSRHFYYVDESVQQTELSANSNSSNSRSNTASHSARPSRQSVSHSKTPSHFRVGGTGGAATVERSVSGSVSTQSTSQSSSRSSGAGGAHFRYSDNEDAQSTSRTPALPSLSHSPSHSAVKAEGFHSFSQLDLQTAEQPTSSTQQPAEKKAVRVVRPGQQ